MRKAVFVILIFVILFININVVLADLIIKLPPPPSGKNFVIGYLPNVGTYRLGTTDYSDSIYISEDGVLTDKNGNSINFNSLYELKNGSWVKYSDGAYWKEWYEEIGFTYQGGKVIIFSSNNFYGKKGQLLASAASDDVLRNGVTIIGKYISSSKILLYILYPFRQILPYIVVAIVSIVSFYKVWRWLSGQIQGI